MSFKIQKRNSESYKWLGIEISNEANILVEIKDAYATDDKTHKIINFKDGKGCVSIEIPIKIWIQLLYEIREDL